MRFANVFKFAVAFAVLATGGAIYLLFRPDTLLMFGVLKAIGLGNATMAARAWADGVTLGSFIVYSLPAGLWSAAYIMAMDALWSGASRTIRLMFSMLIPLVGVASEIMQGLGLLRGIYDHLDMVCYAVPILIYILILQKEKIAYGFRLL